MSMKNSNDVIGNRTLLVAQFLDKLRHRDMRVTALYCTQITAADNNNYFTSLAITLTL
jgi:hypothetical protein